MTDTIPVHLYRFTEHASGDQYHGSMRIVTGGADVTLLGVATRPSGHPIAGAPDRETFEDNVAETATDVRWFDEEMQS